MYYLKSVDAGGSAVFYNQSTLYIVLHMEVDILPVSELQFTKCRKSKYEGKSSIV